MAQRKNPHAIALGKLGAAKGGHARAQNLTPAQLSKIGRKGGKIGGRARAAALTPEQRSAIARKAAVTRWGKREEK